MNRTATAVWNGSGKEGSGHLTTQSNTLNKTQYSWKARFEESIGTNPEELIAAAHAGCFTMKLSFLLGAAGVTPEMIETTSTITMDKGVISDSHLSVKAKAPGLTKEKLEECANDAKANCMVSKVLNLNITMDVSLA